MILKVLLTIAHIVVSVILILVVLLQTGKRADLAGAFGGGGSQTAFGARGAATLLSKATTVAAIVFMLTSLGLALMSNRGGTGSTQSVVQDNPAPASSPAPAPATPSTGTPADATPAPPSSDAGGTAPGDAPTNPGTPSN